MKIYEGTRLIQTSSNSFLLFNFSFQHPKSVFNSLLSIPIPISLTLSLFFSTLRRNNFHQQLFPQSFILLIYIHTYIHSYIYIHTQVFKEACIPRLLPKYPVPPKGSRGRKKEKKQTISLAVFRLGRKRNETREWILRFTDSSLM